MRPPVTNSALTATAIRKCAVARCGEKNYLNGRCTQHAYRSNWPSSWDEIQRKNRLQAEMEQMAMNADHFTTRSLDLDQLPDLGHFRTGNALNKFGYVYALEFSTGVVKVGSTTNPYQRVKTHMGNAGPFNVSIDALWLSKFHDNYKSNEKWILGALGSPSHGCEYFTGVRFDAVVAMAETALVYRQGRAMEAAA
ncbi:MULTISPECIES: GIY-YIG nuclease family protein [Nocardia]|uniref:GIY-YIG nuclease family protein n=1 Tax=Nocardia TaxID=1817 RepID=UPI0013008940|nr:MULTISPECIES: GIY-YIG nuclease family protein [Nocardia]